MNVKIDVRESDLIEQVKYFIGILPIYKDINVIVETLPLGDIILENSGSEKLIIERKSLRDLGASIKDGRYNEQSYRLNGIEIPNHNIIYLIEGDINKINKFVDKTDKITIFSAIFSLNYYKGFSVIRTMNMEETALFICNCANKLRKGGAEQKLPYYQIQTFKKVEQNNESTNEEHTMSQTCIKVEDSDEKDYVGVVKKVKKENITPQNIDEIMLSQIPGVSSTTAIAIIKEFQSICNLIKQLEEKGADSLKNISYTTTKGQSRKINKTSVANIAKFLLKV
uniref:ERCC4 domain-containing protein n=1 Tax=viral metagenome TaxID=1070528 RepID=A0A6C0DT36_9ZZZZ